MKWPLTGGVPSEMSLNEDHAVERIYIAGYQDGSVRIWDATFPVLMPMFVLDGKVSLICIYIITGIIPHWLITNRLTPIKL
jgi:hypothetical protein